MTTDVDEVLAVALEVVCAHLEALSGMLWQTQPDGTWRAAARVGPAGEGQGVACGSGAADGPVAGGLPPVVAAMVNTATPSTVWRCRSVGAGRRAAGCVAGPAGPDTVVCAAALVGRPDAPAGVLEVAVDGGSVDAKVLLAVCETVGELLSRVVQRAADQVRLAEAQQTARVGSWTWDVVEDEVSWSQQMYVNYGIDPSEFDPTLDGYLQLVHPGDRGRLRETVTGALEDGRAYEVVHRVAATAGELRWIECRGEVHHGPDGSPVRLSGTAQDITARKQLEQELAYRSTHDVATGLANRAAFQESLEALLETGDEAWTALVAVVDIDGFGTVSGQVGSAAADELLRRIADRLVGAFPDQATVARLAGDEFAVVAPALQGGPDDAAQLGRMVLAVFDEPFTVAEQVRRLTASVGVATNATGTESADDLLRDAYVAVDLAKTRGGASCQLFDPDDHAEVLQQLALEEDLRQAVEESALEVAFQPVVSLRTGRVVATEALVRWHRGGHGPVSPADFIPIAEELGLASRLGAHVLLVACQQTRTWQRQLPEATDLQVAVNLSPLQLDDPQLVETVEEALTRSGLAPQHLTLEITESAVPTDAPGALSRLWELRRRGIKIAIDDFGTGYSSLSRLRELPVDVLKIDRSFLQNADGDAPILQALFSMAHTLELSTIAEGVETPGQLQAVLAHDCQQVQGFLFARPLGADGIGRLLTDPTWDTDLHAAAAVDTDTRPADGADARPAVDIDLTERQPVPGRLEQLLQALHTADSPERVEQLLTEVLDAVAEATGMDSVYVTHIDFDAGRQHIDAAVNRGAIEIPVGLSTAWSDTICRRALTEDRTTIEDVPASCPDLEVADDLDITTYLTAPIPTTAGGLHGTLCAVAATRRTGTAAASDLLQHIAPLLSSALTVAAGHTSTDQ